MQTRFLLVIACVAFLGILAAFYLRPVGSTLELPSSAPRSEGITLSPQTLSPSEKILMVIQSTNRWGEIQEKVYQINGGRPLRFAASDLHASGDALLENLPPRFGIVDPEEASGIDAYLLFLRRGFQGDGHSTERVTVGYYRDGKKIGEERFHDTTSISRQIRWVSGHVVRPFDGPVEDFPAEVFREVLPPHLIEEKLKAPNKAPEPTPTAVTSPAAQEPRQP